MTWLPIIVLAGLAFAFAAYVLKLPRAQWMLFAAALLVGLAGYGWQGSPGQAAAPAAKSAMTAQGGEMMVAARREFYPQGVLPSRYVVTADAFARQGQYDDAANFLRNAVAENPQDGEAWLALGNALIEHAEGRMTKAAFHAYRRAHETQPGNPAPTYFLGLAYLREGDPMRTWTIWRSLVDNAPPDAAWRPLIEERIGRLEQLMAGGMTVPDQSTKPAQ